MAAILCRRRNINQIHVCMNQLSFYSNRRVNNATGIIFTSLCIRSGQYDANNTIISNRVSWNVIFYAWR